LVVYKSDISCLADDKLEEKEVDEPRRLISLACKVSDASVATS